MEKRGLRLSVHEMETSVLHPDLIIDGAVGKEMTSDPLLDHNFAPVTSYANDDDGSVGKVSNQPIAYHTTTSPPPPPC